MDSVKMNFALALCLSLGLIAVEPVYAQSSDSFAEISATVDGVRGRCGLGLLARTISSQTCQSFKNYGSRMQCVANDLSDATRAKASPILVDVARCYRELGDALVAGRGSNNDQVNALEDVCRNLRHETVVPRSPNARDAVLIASDLLMPGFSRKAVSVPTNSPMLGIRLHDLPDCAVALAIPPEPPKLAGAPGAIPPARAGNGAVTSAVPSPSLVYLTPSATNLAPASSPTNPTQAFPASLAEGQATREDGQAASPTGSARKPSSMPDERLGAGKLAEGLVDRTVGNTKARPVPADINASAPISESAVISALPAVSSSVRKPIRRTTAKAERNPAGYGVATGSESTRSTPRTVAGANSGAELQSGARSSNSNGAGYGYSASSPPALPLTGPPLRPQSAGSVR